MTTKPVRSLPLVLLGLLTILGTPAQATAQEADDEIPAGVERYVIDPTHTYVGFSARHMLVTKVRGKFNEFEGEILYHPEDVSRSTVDVTIHVPSVDTDNERRDAHLRSADFFEAETYPTITFHGTGVEEEGGQLFLVGDLTIKETTREVRIPFEIFGPVDVGGGQKRLGAEGEITVDRFDWGLEWNRMIETGGLVVSEDVTLELNVEARSAEGS